MRDQLSSLFTGAATAGLVVPGADVVAEDRPAPVHQLILPPDVARVARAEQFASGDRRAFEAFAETDLDDLTGILSVSALLEHAREMERRLPGSAGEAEAGPTASPTSVTTDDGQDMASSAA
jgi:hypothetical protein